MKTRFFRVKSSRQWASVTCGSEGDFSTPASSHLESIASSLSLPVADLEVVEVEGQNDPRTGTLLRPIIQVVPPSRPAVLLAWLKAGNSLTPPELNEALILLMERLT